MGERSVSRPLNLVAEATPSCLSLAGDAIVPRDGESMETLMLTSFILMALPVMAQSNAPNWTGTRATWNDCYGGEVALERSKYNLLKICFLS